MSQEQTSGISETEKARFNMARNNVKFKLADSGALTFIVPDTLEKNIRKEYNFSVDMLGVGGDIPLADLAIHCDEQASKEYHIGILAEFTKYQLKQAQDDYEAWYGVTFYKVKKNMQEAGQKNITDKGVESRMQYSYPKKMRKLKQRIADLDFKHRVLGVIKACFVTKGTLLPTIRNIVQGRGTDGVVLDSKHSDKVRRKLDFLNN